MINVNKKTCIILLLLTLIANVDILGRSLVRIDVQQQKFFPSYVSVKEHKKMPSSHEGYSLLRDTAKAQNVVFIISDDHATGVYGAYGNDIIRTPNLDKFANTGVRFTHAYANAPVCTPSRQSLLTGKMPSATGVTLLRTALSDDQFTLADYLDIQGFRTAAIGKMHFNSNLKHGFEVRIDRSDYDNYLKQHPAKEPPENLHVRPPWKPFKDPARIWLNAGGLPVGKYEKDTEAHYLTEQAVKFIKANKNKRFLLWLGYHEPHSPFTFPIEYQGKYNLQDMPLPQTSPEDEQWMPDIFEGLTKQDKKGIIRSYYTSVEFLDTNIGQVLDALDQLELSDNTLVIYVSDHGYLLGDHGRFEKHMMWEPAVKIPLVIKSPGIPSHVEEAMVEGVDLLPTILDILDVPPIKQMQGESLKPLLRGKTDQMHQAVFSEFLADNKAMIRTQRWKYIFTTGRHDLAQGYATGNPPPGITERLYDLKNDPNEMHNLAGNPHFTGIITYLKEKLFERFMKTDPRAHKLPRQYSLEQALVWFCEPPENIM